MMRELFESMGSRSFCQFQANWTVHLQPSKSCAAAISLVNVATCNTCQTAMKYFSYNSGIMLLLLPRNAKKKKKKKIPAQFSKPYSLVTLI